jgi:hypothetical protein
MTSRNSMTVRICRVCSKTSKQVRFDLTRNLCHSCRGKLRRGTIEPAPVPPKPEAPPVDPLESAYQQRHAKDERSTERKQRDALLDENKHLKAQIGQLVKMQVAPDILVYSQPAHERVDAIACGVASDWHVEEEVVAAAVHGLNEYNLDIAKSRSEHFFKGLLRLANIMAKDSKINSIYLAAIGDFFSGHIHDELKASTLLAPGDAARFVMGLWFSGIDYILKNSKFTIEGDMIPGNHGRMTEQMWFSDPTGTSLETFMYHAIAGRYQDNPRVRLRVSEHAMVYRRFFERFNMRLIHGYEVKYGGGVGGITIPIRKALAQWNNPIRADLTVMGHFHQLFDGGDFIVNGSLIGYNTFAQAIKASYEEPRQAFFLVHARSGGQKAVTAPIWLEPGKTPTEKIPGDL